MLKSILNLDGVAVIKRTHQKKINGGVFIDDSDNDNNFGVCETLNSFFCGIPFHICCNGQCVLPEHPACGI